MAALLNRNGWYYAQFYDRTRTPKRKQLPLHTRTRKTALRVLAKLEDQVAEGKLDPWATTVDPGLASSSIVTLGEAIAAFLAAKAHLRPAGLSSYATRLRLFERHVGAGLPLASLQSSHVAAFLNAAAVRDVTRRGYLMHLRVFFRWGVRIGALSSDVGGDVHLRRVPERAPCFLTPQELTHLLSTIRKGGRDGWMVPVVEATAFLGLRLGEACALTWQSVDLERARLTVSNTDTFTSKSGKERTLPLAPRPLAILQTLRAERTPSDPPHVFLSSRRNGVYPNLLSRRFCLYRRSAGLPEGLTFHSLRHTAASWLMMSGASIEAVRQYLGHSSIAVTQRYAHLSDASYFEQVSGALDRLWQQGRAG